MLRLISLLCLAVVANAHEKCKVSDEACLLRLSKDMFSVYFAEGELDPMHHDLIEGNLANLKYNLRDITVKGFKSCIMEYSKIEFDKLKLEVKLLCPKLFMDGKYDVKGQILLLPVEGDGSYVIESKKYSLKISMNMELRTNEGKTYAKVKSYKFDAEPLEGVEYKFNNLFNGNKELAEPLLKLVNENSKAVAKELQGPVLQADIGKIVKVFNEVLKKHAIDEYLILE